MPDISLQSLSEVAETLLIPLYIRAMVFDAFSPFFVWANNRRVARTKIGAPCHWALKRGQGLEDWGDGICLLDEWYPFQYPEPRLGKALWVRHIPLLAKTMGVFHYRLGKTVR